MNRRILLPLIALVSTGCHSLQLEPYTAARVTGRVVAADTRQPIEGVAVTRDYSERRPSAAESPKGAQLLFHEYTTRTGSDGRFVFSSQRALTLFHPTDQQFVMLAFERAGFEGLQTNFSMLKLGTNSPSGEPLLDAGDVLLRPVGRPINP